MSNWKEKFSKLFKKLLLPVNFLIQKLLAFILNSKSFFQYDGWHLLNTYYASDILHVVNNL